jgi:cell wall-associated NlpC family hydrolase
MQIDDYRTSWPTPSTGWPGWLSSVPYVGSRHPLADSPGPIEAGANCQRYAYAVLAQFGLYVPPVRSSELWTHPGITQISREDLRPLDLVLFNANPGPFGAHVGIHMAPDQVLHLCAEEGRPVVWGYADFAARVRYAALLGGVRLLAADSPSGPGRTAAWAEVPSRLTAERGLGG